MSIINHIIIPTVGSKQNLEDQNIFIPSSFVITPSKHEELPSFACWKKSSSAFKRFKQKKDKKMPRYLPNNQNKQPEEEHPAKYFKLRQRHYAIQSHQHPHHQLPFGYFDPNQAPLYQMHLEYDSEHLYKPKQTKFKMEEEIQQIKLQRIQSQIIEQDEHKFIIEPRQDDPFIIIRKDHKKNNKHIKTKNIKKQRNTKVKEIDQIKGMGGKAKEAAEVNKNAGMSTSINQSFSAPILITPKTSMPIALDHSSSNSPQSSQERRPIMKKIQTIEHLMALKKPNQTSNTEQCEEGLKEEEHERYQQ